MTIKSNTPVILSLVASAILLSACGGEPSASKELSASKEPSANQNTSATEKTSKTAKQAEPAQENHSENTGKDSEAVLKTQIESAKKTTKIFASTLKGELQKAMKAGGPVNALTVCNLEAMPITKRVAKEQGAQLSRVSLKNRNPRNIPNDWQKTVLEDFDARAAKGEDVKTMAFAKIVEEGGKKHFRFMKALPTGQVCLKCHGTNLAPEVSAKLNELYPNDKATGYQPGQVRGAIVITKDL